MRLLVILTSLGTLHYQPEHYSVPLKRATETAVVSSAIQNPL